MAEWTNRFAFVDPKKKSIVDDLMVASSSIFILNKTIVCTKRKAKIFAFKTKNSLMFVSNV